MLKFTLFGYWQVFSMCHQETLSLYEIGVCSSKLLDCGDIITSETELWSCKIELLGFDNRHCCYAAMMDCQAQLL